MATRPTVSSLNANSVGIINAIRNNASSEYYNAVPEAVQTTESIRAVGEAICGFRPRMNEFVSALVNRIALVVVTSKVYSNPWAFAKKGILEYGETIEEIFVDIANVYPFDPENAASTVFQREKPNVLSMFHAMNMRSQYPTTVSEKELRKAFLSLDGVTDLITRITNSLYSAMNYDEYIMMKYLIAKLALDGSITSQVVEEVDDEDSAKSNIVKMKATLNLFKFMSNNYNVAGVKNFCPTENAYVITSAEFDAYTDVEVMAKAFNIDRADWLGRHIQIDSFAFNDGENERLAMLLADDPDVTISDNKVITADENTALAKINSMILDKDFFQIYDNLTEFTEIYNPKGLYWNEFLHVWRTYSASPFANIVMFITDSSAAVTAITVNGAQTADDGATYVYTATVTAGLFANKGVTWKVEAATPGASDSWTAGDLTKCHLDQNGRIVFDVGASGGYKITATSVATSSVSGNITVVVS